MPCGRMCRRPQKLRMMEPRQGGSMADPSKYTPSQHVTLPNLVVVYERTSNYRNLPKKTNPSVKDHSRSSEADTDRSATYNLGLLLLIRSNHGPISYRLQDKRRFLSKVQISLTPSPHLFNAIYLTPPRGLSLLGIVTALGLKRTRVKSDTIVIYNVKKCIDMCIRLYKISDI